MKKVAFICFEDMFSLSFAGHMKTLFAMAKFLRTKGIEYDIHFLSNKKKHFESLLKYDINLYSNKKNLNNNIVFYNLNGIDVYFHLFDSSYSLIKYSDEDYSNPSLEIQNYLTNEILLDKYNAIHSWIEAVFYSNWIKSLKKQVFLFLHNNNFNNCAYSDKSFIKIKKLLLQKNLTILSPSLYIKSQFKKTWNIETTEYLNFIDFEELKNKSIDPFNNEFITFFNPCLEKGVTIVNKLIEINKDKMFLIINGWGEKQPEKFTDANNVIFINNTRNVDKIYSISKIVLYPSLWEEAWGRTLIESSFLNVPFIATNRGGISEATYNCVQLIPIENYEIVVDNFNSIINNIWYSNSLYHAYLQNQLKIYKNFFTKQEKSILNLYNIIINKST